MPVKHFGITAGATQAENNIAYSAGNGLWDSAFYAMGRNADCMI
jgi:hypothetical protein